MNKAIEVPFLQLQWLHLLLNFTSPFLSQVSMIEVSVGRLLRDVILKDLPDLELVQCVGDLNIVPMEVRKTVVAIFPRFLKKCYKILDESKRRCQQH